MEMDYYLHKYRWWSAVFFLLVLVTKWFFLWRFPEMELDAKYIWLLFCCNRVTCSLVWPPTGAVVLPVKHQGKCYTNLFQYRSVTSVGLHQKPRNQFRWWLIQVKQAPSNYWLGCNYWFWLFNGRSWSRFRIKMMPPGLQEVSISLFQQHRVFICGSPEESCGH